jgi:hypothetical protein
VGVSQFCALEILGRSLSVGKIQVSFNEKTCTWDHQSARLFAVLFLVSLIIVPWGDRVREEAQRETDSLRVYVGSVEAAAAGLLSRVQELEHLLALCMHPTLMFL